MIEDKIYAKIIDYFGDKIMLHGSTPRGVDWNSIEAQYIRFEQQARVIQKNNFSVNDFGCGYGEFCLYLDNLKYNFEYCGLDVSSAMVAAAEKKLTNFKNKKLICDYTPDKARDYSIASGIFHAKTDLDTAQWEKYILNTLLLMREYSTAGFVFNMLTKYSDQDKMKDYLYYADPCYWFDLCKKQFSKNIALLHDYNLYEFTILVRL